jgi:hypothetical protein
MLFLVVQEHSPENCPARRDLGPDSLFGDLDGTDVRFAVADVPGHRLTFLIEAASYDALEQFLEPGRAHCTTTISPVKDLSSFARD